MRINTILDAMLIADSCGAEFGFLWDESEQPALDQQTTSSLASVFDSWAASHLRSGPPGRDDPILGSPVRDAAAREAVLDLGRKTGCLLLDQPRDLHEFFAAFGPWRTDAYRQAFQRIGFSKPVRAAIAAAHAIDIAPHSAAIHLRGGDILHGTHSFHGTYLHKAPSLPQIEARILAVLAEGRPLWLVGQEPDIQRAMVARFGGVRAFGVTDAMPRLDPVSAVIFDAVFMGRMEQIFGGNSGVTLLSRRLGNIGFTDIGRTAPLPPQSLIPDPFTASDYAGVSAQSKAHAFAQSVVSCAPELWTDTHLTLIRQARSYRPGNSFLLLLEICLVARLQSPADAELLARRLLVAPPREAGITDDMGFAFLMGADHYFPLAMVRGLPATPALDLLAKIGAALTDPRLSPQARAALRRVEESLEPARIDPAFQMRLERCLEGTISTP